MAPPSLAVAELPAVDRSRDRILDAAIELYARYGVAGVSQAQLAEHVGLHKSTLFHHFASKAEIAEAALRRAIEPISQLVEGLDHDQPPHLDQLIGLAIELDVHFGERPAAARFLLRALVGPGDELEDHPALNQPEHPVNRIFFSLGRWFDNARRGGAIRPLGVRHAIVNLLGLCLLYPAIAEELARDVFGGDRAQMRRARRRELETHLRGAYAV